MYFITVSNGLLSPTHRKRMGVALWEFLWCIDQMTELDADGIGVVRGGAPTKLIEIASTLGSLESSVSRNLRRLSASKYIVLTYAPYGIVIRVPKAKKRFGLQVHSQVAHRVRTSAGPRCRSAQSGCISEGPNKTSIETEIEDKADQPSVLENSRIQAIKDEITKLVSTFR
jgi:hypothetical protein